MSEAGNPQISPTPPTFEQALARLEQIVSQLEDGRADLTAALGGYEEGVRLLGQCHSLLERAERRIEVLSGVDAEGRPITTAFDDAATISADDVAQTRSKRRSTKKVAPAAAASDGATGAIPPAVEVDEAKTLF